MNLFARFERVFKACASRTALEADGKAWSYGELNELAGRAAAVLTEQGVEPGARVLVRVDKSVQAVGLYLGCLKRGAVYVPINPGYTDEEVDYFVADAKPKLFVGGEVRGDVPSLTLDKNGAGSFAERVAKAQTASATVSREDGDTAAIVYTSGTTGHSKGAVLSHDNLASNAATLIDYWGWQDDDVLLHALPIFHVHGLFVALHCAFLSGTKVLFQSGFNVDALIDALPRSTVLMGVPTFYTRLLDSARFDRACCAHMRLFISGSAPLTEQTFTAFEERTGMKILERYGMSETLMNTSNPLDGERIAGTVGFALPGVAVRIADDAGTVLGAGEVGGIEVRGPNVFSGYWRKPEKTAEEFRRDGFFKTGDLGVMDDEGRCAIVGRAKDLVISGGYNVYPKEVERLLDEMPGVAESAVIGVPHADFGEAVVAVVVPTGKAVEQEAVDAHLAERLARYKQPKRVLCVNSLPRNTMGKVQKNQLREEFKTLFS